MAVEFVAKTEVKPGDGSSIQISIPTGWSVGDVLIAYIIKDDDDAITPPAGWTVIQNVTGGTAMRLWTGYRIAESGDTNWTWSGDAELYYGVILCYKGNAAAPVPNSGSATGSDAIPIAPSVAFSELNAGSLVLQVFGADRDRWPFTIPSQLTEKFKDYNSGSGGCGGAGGDKLGDWISPTGFNDPDTAWANEEKLYDENLTTATDVYTISGGTWTNYIELTHSAITCSKIRFKEYYSTYIDEVSIDVYYSDAWHNIYEGAKEYTSDFVEKSIGSIQTITAVRFKFYNSDSSSRSVFFYEVDFYKPMAGSGNTGTATFAQDASDEWAAVTMVIEAASAAGEFYKSLAGVFTATGAIVKLPKISLAGVFSSVGSITRKISLGLAGNFGLTGIVSSIFKFPKSLAGVFGLTGTIIKLPKISLSGVFSPTGTISSVWKAFKTLAGTFGLTGTLVSSFKFFKSIAGVFGLTGTVVKLPKITLAGILSATGVIIKLPKIALSGVFNFTGSLLKKIIISLSGTFNLTGTISDVFKRFVSLAGTFGLTGTISTVKKVFKVLAGVFTVTGSIGRLIKIGLTGVFSATGVVSSVWKSFQSLAGTFNLIGTIVKLPKIGLSGSFDFAGETSKKIKISLAGVFSSTGTIGSVKRFIKSLIGVFDLVGSGVGQLLGGIFYKSLAGAFDFSGSIARKTLISLVGVFGATGSITSILTKFKSLVGTFDLTGTISKLPKIILSGVLSAAGSIVGIFVKSLAGVLNFTGSIVKLPKIILSGTFGLTGVLGNVKRFIKSLTGVFGLTGNIARKIIISLSGVFSSTGTIIKLPKIILSGTFNLTGGISTVKKIFKAISGVFNLTGVIVKLPKITLLGVFNLTGTISRLIKKTLSGVLTSTGDLASNLLGLFYKTLSGTFNFTGNVGRLTKISLSGVFGLTGIVSTVKKVFKSLAGAFNLTGIITSAFGYTKSLTGTFGLTGTINVLIKKTLSGYISLSGYFKFRTIWMKVVKTVDKWTRVIKDGVFRRLD